MNKVINRLFENTLSLYDLISLYLIGMVSATISPWLFLLIIPNMYFSLMMSYKAGAGKSE